MPLTDHNSEGLGISDVADAWYSRRPTPSSMTSVIYEHLRQEILTGALRAGTRLQQAELAKLYGVSITPVREALSALTVDGFIDTSPFAGSTVHRPTLKELDDIYAVRAALTPMMVREAVRRISPDQVARARQLAERMRTGSVDLAWTLANRDFHMILDSACDNQQLSSVMGHLADLSRGYVALSMTASTTRREQADDEHVRLVEMYEQRNAKGAVEVSLRHIKETHRLVRAVFEQLPAVGHAGDEQGSAAATAPTVTSE